MNEITGTPQALGQKPVALRNTVRAFISRGEDLLLIKSVHPETKGAVFVLPGGGQAPGASLVETLQRECLEEIDLAPRVGDLLCVHEYERNSKSGLLHIVEFIFECTIEDAAYLPKCGTKPDPHQVEVRWVPSIKAAQLPFAPGLNGMIEILLRKQGPRYLGSLQTSGMKTPS